MDVYKKGEGDVLQRVPLLVFHWWWFRRVVLYNVV